MTEMRVGMAALPASKVFKVVKVFKDFKVVAGKASVPSGKAAEVAPLRGAELV